MNIQDSRLTVPVLTALVSLCCVLACNTKPSALPIYSVGVVTWVGYAPFFVGVSEKIFQQEGLDLQVKVMDGPGQREAAFAANRIHFFPNTPDAFSLLESGGVGGTLVLPLDQSAGADGIVAKTSIKSVRDLRGMEVAVQTGMTGHFLLLYVLNKSGLGPADVRIVSMGAGEAGAAFVSGGLDAAVTWEPWLSKAGQRKDGYVLTTSSDAPGLLVDVVMVSDALLREKPEDITRFMRGWYRSVKYMQEHKEESRNILAKFLDVPAEEVDAMLASVKFYNCREASDYMSRPGESQSSLRGVLNLARRLYREAGVISQSSPAAHSLKIDDTLLREVCR